MHGMNQLQRHSGESSSSSNTRGRSFQFTEASLSHRAANFYKNYWPRAVVTKWGLTREDTSGAIMLRGDVFDVDSHGCVVTSFSPGTCWKCWSRESSVRSW
jgi:hypothetical protein